MKDKEKFKGFMMVVGELFDKNISQELLDVYWQILKPFNNDQCEEAFKKVMTTAKFFPKPAEILEHLIRGYTSLSAWQAALGALKESGPYTSVCFEDRAIHLTIEMMGGWPVFCSMENDQIKWKQIEFEKIYKGVCGGDSKFPEHLHGISEKENFRTGHINYDTPAVIIGDTERKMIE